MKPFVAGAGGAAAGSGLLGGLGRILSPLDYPRQALYNLGSGLAEGDLRKALPGLIGAGVALPLIATGVGAPLGILAGSAAGGLAQGLVGKEAPETSALVEALGGDKDSFLQNMLVGAITDPLTYAGGLGGLRTGAKAAQQGGKSAFGALKPLRERVGMVKGIRMLDDPDEIARIARREKSGTLPRRTVVSGDPDQQIISTKTGGTYAQAKEASEQFVEDAMAVPKGGRLRGTYNPNTDMLAMAYMAPASTRRHESIHALIDQASKAGEYGGLPLSMQVPARLIRSPWSFTRGLGEIADETVAHGLTNKGLSNQLGGAWKFLTNPHQGYVNQFSQSSPLAAKLYGYGRYLPYAPYVVGGGLGAGLGASLFNQE